MINFQTYARLLQRDLFRDIDMAFAQLLHRVAPEEPPEVLMAALLISRATGEGHVCIDLHQWGKKAIRLPQEDGGAVPCPGAEEWIVRLRASELVGNSDGDSPLVLDDKGRLYLQRLYRDERQLAEALRSRALAQPPTFSITRPDEVGPLLKRYFKGSDPDKGPDWQKVAAVVTILKRLCIISGAPGTGKTTTVAKMLGVLLEMTLPHPLRIHLCTPTGKAAARLGEALAEASRQLDCPAAVAATLADLVPCTIHRLLGVQRGGGGKGFRYHEGNRLPTDLVVVDEASMVDLVLMSRLVRAVPEEARLVILGDKDQLASVEAGAVFGDLCRQALKTSYSKTMRHAIVETAGVNLDPHVSGDPPRSVLRDCLVVLRTNYRFAPEEGIGAVARAVNTGHSEELLDTLKASQTLGVRWMPWRTRRDYDKVLAAQALRGYEPYLASRGPEEALSRFSRFMILSVLKSGPFGVEGLNALVMAILQQKRLIGRSRPWFAGRPVMITRNHYPLRLYNGDTGLTWPDADGRLKVWFEGEESGLRAISPRQLPRHQTVFAMTVHKSQGSEFDHALLVLPDQDTPVLTRELVYTGCTRARRHLTLMAQEEMIALALSRTVQRTSGLVDALQQ
jgi:exodeoxyribonuclease V alpha subunit